MQLPSVKQDKKTMVILSIQQYAYMNSLNFLEFYACIICYASTLIGDGCMRVETGVNGGYFGI